MNIFSNSLMIDDKHAYMFENDSVEVSIDSISSDTKSLALIFYDLHPMANKWVHWCVINIPSSVKLLPSGVSNTSRIPLGCVELINSFGEKGYGGMCPPKEDGIHQYQLSVFEINVEQLNIAGFISYDNFKSQFSNNIISESQLISLYRTK